MERPSTTAERVWHQGGAVDAATVEQKARERMDTYLESWQQAWDRASRGGRELRPADSSGTAGGGA